MSFTRSFAVQFTSLNAPKVIKDITGVDAALDKAGDAGEKTGTSFKEMSLKVDAAGKSFEENLKGADRMRAILAKLTGVIGIVGAALGAAVTVATALGEAYARSTNKLDRFGEALQDSEKFARAFTSAIEEHAKALGVHLDQLTVVQMQHVSRVGAQALVIEAELKASITRIGELQAKVRKGPSWYEWTGPLGTEAEMELAAEQFEFGKLQSQSRRARAAESARAQRDAEAFMGPIVGGPKKGKTQGRGGARRAKPELTEPTAYETQSAMSEELDRLGEIDAEREAGQLAAKLQLESDRYALEAQGVEDRLALRRAELDEQASIYAAGEARVTQFADATAASFVDAGVGAIFFGDSLREGLKRAGQALLRMAAVEAIMELGRSWAAAASFPLNPLGLVQAHAHKMAAGYFGILAAGGLAVAAGTGGLGGGGGGGGGSAAGPTPLAPSFQGGGARGSVGGGTQQPTVVNNYINAGQALTTRREIAELVARATRDAARLEGVA